MANSNVEVREQIVQIEAPAGRERGIQAMYRLQMLCSHSLHGNSISLFLPFNPQMRRLYYAAPWMS